MKKELHPVAKDVPSKTGGWKWHLKQIKDMWWVWLMLIGLAVIGSFLPSEENTSQSYNTYNSNSTETSEAVGYVISFIFTLLTWVWSWAQWPIIIIGGLWLFHGFIYSIARKAIQDELDFRESRKSDEYYDEEE